MEITFVSRDADALQVLQNELSDVYGSSKYSSKYVVKDIRKKADLDGYDVYVSPANSFGELQGGGVDMQYFLHFGRKELQDKVYKEIKTRYQGEVLIGEFCVITLPENKLLLMCPTMTIPTDVSQTRNAYYFTRAMLKGLLILQKTGRKIGKVFCPIPCIGVGGMDPELAAKQIKAGFDAFDGMGRVIDVYDDTSNVLQAAKMMCISMVRKH